MAHDHVPLPTRASAFALGALSRLALTGLAIGALWLAVAWALAG